MPGSGTRGPIMIGLCTYYIGCPIFKCTSNHKTGECLRYYSHPQLYIPTWAFSRTVVVLEIKNVESRNFPFLYHIFLTKTFLSLELQQFSRKPKWGYKAEDASNIVSILRSYDSKYSRVGVHLKIGHSTCAQSYHNGPACTGSRTPRKRYFCRHLWWRGCKKNLIWAL